MRICIVQRISDGMKECEGDGSQRKSEAVEKECRTSGGQTDMTDLRKCIPHPLFLSPTTTFSSSKLRKHVVCNRSRKSTGAELLRTCVTKVCPHRALSLMLMLRVEKSAEWKQKDETSNKHCSSNRPTILQSLSQVIKSQLQKLTDTCHSSQQKRHLLLTFLMFRFFSLSTQVFNF